MLSDAIEFAIDLHPIVQFGRSDLLRELVTRLPTVSRQCIMTGTLVGLSR